MVLDAFFIVEVAVTSHTSENVTGENVTGKHLGPYCRTKQFFSAASQSAPDPVKINPGP